MFGSYWTAEEVAALDEIKNKETLSLVAKRLGKSERAVLAKLDRMGRPLRKRHYKHWSPKDVEFLIEFSDLYSAEEMAEIFKRNRRSVLDRAKREGVKLITDRKVHWDKEVISYIRTHSPDECVHSLSESVGKSVRALTSYLSRHELPRKKCRCVVKNKRSRVIEFIKENPNMTIKEMSASLGFSQGYIRRVCKLNNLPYKYDRKYWEPWMNHYVLAHHEEVTQLIFSLCLNMSKKIVNRHMCRLGIHHPNDFGTRISVRTLGLRYGVPDAVMEEALKMVHFDLDNLDEPVFNASVYDELEYLLRASGALR